MLLVCFLVFKASNNLTPVYTTTESLADALNAVMLENNDWYSLLSHTHQADQLEVAALLGARIYKTSDDDANIINPVKSADTTSLQSILRLMDL